MPKPKEPQEYDFCAMAYFSIGLSNNQKLAVLNFFSVIATSTPNNKINKIELAFMDQYFKEFGVTGNQFLAYILMGGRGQTIADIKSLDIRNLQDLVYATTELFNCDGSMTEEQFEALLNWLDEIGMSIDEWLDLGDNINLY